MAYLKNEKRRFNRNGVSSKGVTMTKFKKSITVLLSVLGIGTTIIGFSACSDETPPDKGCGVYGKYVNYVLNADGNSYTIEMFNSSIIQDFDKYEDFEKEYDDLMAKTDELVIPATYNGKSVTAVGNYAFASCSFTKVVLPDTIKTVGFNAFSNCDNLNSVVVGSSVSSIGFGAFTDCYKLVEVYNRSTLTIEKGSTGNGSVAKYAKDVYVGEYTSKLSSDKNGFVTYTSGADKILVNYYGGIFNPVLPDGITEINAYAFAGYDQLRSVTIPTSLKKIQANAFYRCNKMERAYIPDLESWCEVELEDYSANPMNYATTTYVGGKKLTSLTLPQTLKEIKPYTFYNIEGITEVTIPASVEKIGDNAFAWCPDLQTVNLGNSLKEIGKSAFYGCKMLTGVYLPSSLEAIKDRAFAQSGLTGISLPDTTISLGVGVFESCASLTEAELGGVQNIPKETFYGCQSLSEITFSQAVETIAYFAFADCDAIESVSLPATLKTIDECAFWGCDNLLTLTIPDEVYYVGMGAFEYCISLTQVVVGSGVRTLDSYAFYGCSDLQEVFYKGDKNAFNGVTVGGNNDDFNEATLYYYSETTPETDGNFWYYSNGEIKKY